MVEPRAYSISLALRTPSHNQQGTAIPCGKTLRFYLSINLVQSSFNGVHIALSLPIISPNIPHHETSQSKIYKLQHALNYVALEISRCLHSREIQKWHPAVERSTNGQHAANNEGSFFSISGTGQVRDAVIDGRERNFYVANGYGEPMMGQLSVTSRRKGNLGRKLTICNRMRIGRTARMPIWI